MPIFEYRGEAANLKVLAREIEADQHLAGKCSLALTPLQQNRRDSLRHAHWAEISISVAAGLATNTLYGCGEGQPAMAGVPLSGDRSQFVWPPWRRMGADLSGWRETYGSKAFS
ncbi:hypothetical protein OG613_08205 [Streptomyces sp. NBC_00015]|uniref:hypothetical protein n=1 Tax=unclassified Streptomyces TaxID=2593676 RepID=UPI0022524F63|nr:hypothetical protein [Streptomyces sp. NBC_00103]MCX5374193.1 hypothetical protein [Streptomyces sp. NBC_00103]